MEKLRGYYREINSPLGKVLAGCVKDSLVFLQFKDTFNLKNIEKRYGIKFEKSFGNFFLNNVENQLKEYFEKKRKNFDLALHFIVGTDFQKKCWEALMKIPYGQTISYSKQAEMVGNKKAVRAVANANRLNPIAIIVPCHRVIGKNGKLTGYAGGIEKKEYLLKLEGAI
ncbi:methylated-DNA-[protein]-cysteine S-methyltransferase [Thermotomaculum hydrothermale]|uniref:Methylated-DNA-[protein]-cysteine S-methyltransferase n=1 Tax=Thermotomaculum hydrothermale TaxID=981385 RepID=A0A7R6PWA8_9BACT|nr:methylated-DNA--[protein]-cysteine S-methyltransferase [Thermotomaculum hydrothermale]BBB31790.1 methylated-DNA-[protein]-cysteine S-methyltransferase [Thermotomaculum hydrothermale]